MNSTAFSRRCTWSAVLLVGLAAVEPCRGADAIAPVDQPLVLFNGRDLSGLVVWLRDSGHDDPRGVFTVQDGLLHISGEAYGYVRTAATYRDYRLVAEYRWGPRTWAPREKASRDSGIMYHALGPDGATGVWMASLEYQIIEGGTGDLLAVPATFEGQTYPVSVTCEIARDRDGEAVWQPGGEVQRFESGRINWFGRDPDWEDRLGFRGDRDLESPFGEWTHCELIARGDRVEHYVNGRKVCEGRAASPQAGHILLQSEGAEIFFRRLELHPLDEAQPRGNAASGAAGK
ncbi:MAG: DUF1080 domain-containing protein [Pirellulales bacterium]|nr:DUF1080 domain-containing protein [Pirellulales bacterium]